MKILLASRNFNQYQGIERYTLELVKQFIKKHEVHLLTTNYDYKPISNLVVHKTPIIIKKPFWIERLINYYFDTKCAKQIKKEFNIDIVASSECFFCDVIVAHSCYRAAVKEANKISKKEFFYPKYLLYKIRRWLLLKNRVILMLEKRVFERGNKKIITVSKKVKREILENYNVPEKRISVVYHGVDLDEFKPDPEKRLEIRRKYNIGDDDIILMFSGYEFKRKGLKYIIKALPLVKGDVKLVVVSKDNPKPYKKLAISIDVLDKIIFTGFVPKIEDYCAASDIFIFPTLYEPFGIVVIEAMASGLPVIVSKLAGAAEIIKHGYDGLLLDDPTNPNEIAEKINLLINNKNLRKQMGENARKTAQKYSWEETARRTLEVYQEVLEMKKEGNINIDKIPVPLGDKRIPGERDDMFNPQITDKVERYKHLQRYRYAAKRCKGRILDLGCGTGYGTKMLCSKGNEVYGIDNSQKAISYAEKTYTGPEYICCSAEKLPFEDNYFNTVTAFEVIEHVQNPERVLNEIYRVLKKDGSLFISTPNPRHLGNMIKHFLLKKPYPEKIDMNNIYHIKEFYYEKFVDFLRKGKFRIIAQYGQTLPIFRREIIYLLRKLPSFYKIPIFLGYYLPKYAGTIVVWAKK